MSAVRLFMSSSSSPGVLIFRKRCGTIPGGAWLVCGTDERTVAMRYLAAVAVAAFVTVAGLAVHSVGFEKQSTPSTTQLAARLAQSVDPFLLQSGG